MTQNLASNGKRELAGEKGVKLSIILLLHDNDSKYGTRFSLNATVRTGIQELDISPHSPNLNAIGERFIGSLRRERLEHVLILNERQLHTLIKEYVLDFNRPAPARSIWLHYDYRRAA